MIQAHHGAFVGLAWGLMWLVFWAAIIVSRGGERRKMLDIIDRSVQEGKPLPPELLAHLDRRSYGRRGGDLRAGLILVAVGLGLAVAGYINYLTYPGPHSILFYGMYGVFPVPLFIGVAFLVMAYIRRDR